MLQESCTQELIDLPSMQEFYLYKALVHDKLGIHLPDQKRAMLGHRLQKRVNQLHMRSFSEYYQYILKPSNQSELRYMLERITTNETFFFREEKHFDFMNETILPNYRGEEPFRIWSAACATGEEPYSIAMTMINGFFKPWELLATDVNLRVIEHAKKGIYLDDRTTLIPEKYRHRFCRKGQREYEGYMRVIPQVRTSVRFKQFNLLDEVDEIGKFHLIFLRNVLIYFDTDDKTKILSRIASALHPGGWLFTGHSESFHGLCSEFETVQPAVLRLKGGEDE